MSRFEINSMNLVSSWSFNLEKNQDCTICRNHLNMNSGYCVEKGVNTERILQSQCGHMFHEECITPWLRTNGKCPVCCQVWKTVNTFNYENK